MSSDEKFWILLWSIIGVTLISVAVIATNYHYKIKSKMVSVGYEQVTIIGSDRLVWQKKDDECQ